MKKLLVIILCLLSTMFYGCGAEKTSNVFESDIIGVDINTVQSGNEDAVEFEASVNLDGKEYDNAVLAIDEENTSSLTDRHTYLLKLNDKSYRLCNCYGDPSYMREYLSNIALEQNGVTVPKCTYANLSIDGENRGLYLLEENVDENFVKSNFGDDGNLYKPAKGFTVRTGTEDYSDYTLVCGSDENFNNLKILTDKVTKSDDVKCDFLDVDTFLKCIAFDYVFGSYDSINGSGNNYYIYEKDGKFTIIPCDMSGAMGGYDDEDVASLDKPYNGDEVNYPIVTKLLNVDEYKHKYYEYVENYVVWAQENIPTLVNEKSAVIDRYAKNAESAFYTYDEYLNAIAVEEISEEETEIESTQATTQAMTEATTAEQTTVQAEESHEMTTSGLKSSSSMIGKRVVSDSYTSSQAIGIRVTSPADKNADSSGKTKTDSEKEEAKTQTKDTVQSTQPLATEASEGGGRITYSKIYDKQDFSIVTYMLKRVIRISDELAEVRKI